MENQSQDIEIQSEDDKMIATIQEDMKGWANQKMWPYSCYSPTAEKPCLEGCYYNQKLDYVTLYDSEMSNVPYDCVAHCSQRK